MQMNHKKRKFSQVVADVQIIGAKSEIRRGEDGSIFLKHTVKSNGNGRFSGDGDSFGIFEHRQAVIDAALEWEKQRGETGDPGDELGRWLAGHFRRPASISTLISSENDPYMNLFGDDGKPVTHLLSEIRLYASRDGDGFSFISENPAWSWFSRSLSEDETVSEIVILALTGESNTLIIKHWGKLNAKEKGKKVTIYGREVTTIDEADYSDLASLGWHPEPAAEPRA
jgi:hypothetical protein